MKKLTLPLIAALALSACGEEPVAEQAPVETAVAEPVTPSLPPPDEKVFAETFARICTAAKPVNTSVCKRAGMGSPDVVCEYGLGDDEYLRNKAVLSAGDGVWDIVDPETVCATGA